MTKNSLQPNQPLHSLPLHFWLEAVLSITTAAALLLTMLRPTWIELVFGIDPDRSSGSAELLIIFSLATATLALSVLALRTWKSAHA
jgi:hypothetical protein